MVPIKTPIQVSQLKKDDWFSLSKSGMIFKVVCCHTRSDEVEIHFRSRTSKSRKGVFKPDKTVFRFEPLNQLNQG